MSQPTCTHDPKSRKFYDGALGYEAYVCPECGAYWDHYEGEHPPDEWSGSFLRSIGFVSRPILRLLSYKNELTNEFSNL